MHKTIAGAAAAAVALVAAAPASAIDGFPNRYTANAIMSTFNKEARYEGVPLRLTRTLCIDINSATERCRGEFHSKKGLGPVVARPRYVVQVSSDGEQITWNISNPESLPLWVARGVLRAMNGS